eukprot:scaffold24619_cov96-Skeletonema_marinoi.AAC.1
MKSTLSAAYASQSSPARDNNNNNPEIRKLYYGAQLNVQEENNGGMRAQSENTCTFWRHLASAIFLTSRAGIIVI